MRKCRRRAESPALRKCSGAKPGRAAAHHRQCRRTPVVDLVVVDAQRPGHWFKQEKEDIITRWYRRGKRSWDLPEMMPCGLMPCVEASDAQRAIRNCHPSLT